MCASTADLVQRARSRQTVVPAFNVPYLPMMQPIVAALRDTASFGLIQVARLEWIKFEARGLAAVCEEYGREGDRKHTRLHLDHVPVIDEDGERVDVWPVFEEAIRLGYESVMIDGSRLELEENIGATRRLVEMAHAAGVPVEAELGAVMGHEEGPLPPYEELFASGNGFTDAGEARRFVEETGVDWLSVAIGNIHGAVSAAARGRRKPEARLSIAHLDRIVAETDVPIVLHGGSGIRKESVMDGVRHGIAKINIGTAIRQPYEEGAVESVVAGQDRVYEETRRLVTDELEIAGLAERIGAQ